MPDSPNCPVAMRKGIPNGCKLAMSAAHAVHHVGKSDEPIAHGTIPGAALSKLMIAAASLHHTCSDIGGLDHNQFVRR